MASMDSKIGMLKFKITYEKTGWRVSFMNAEQTIKRSDFDTS